MDKQLLDQLRAITEEEQAILDGRTTIDRGLYMTGNQPVVNSKKLLAAGKLITLRTHTRFIQFPEHGHDFVEVVYMCAGKTRHIINGQTITLNQGELLFLGQRVSHEICRAEAEDVAVNFIVLPEFFSDTLMAIGEEASPLRHFLVDCLFGRDIGPGYLHFRVAGDRPVQNLVENLLFTLIRDVPNRRTMSRMTMTLLFMQLLGHTDKLSWSGQDEVILDVMRYVEEQYAQGSLTELAERLCWDVTRLSREIHRKTGKTYNQILQDKRLAQAAFLLRNTDTNVSDISLAVGYENISYFHRIFAETFGKSPKHYRDER
jgi:AraC-like DNA-binding protein/quercetin dioxygenase-like cupin family protein